MPLSPNPQLVYADGPASLPQEPYKPDIRKIWAQVEAAIDAFSSGAGSIAKQTVAQLDSDLAHAADTTAWVYNDPTVGNNGIYRKSGASGTGSWTRILPLPFSFIIASDVGAGTPNAIQAATSIPVSASALIWMNIADTNTGTPVTVSFNGGSPLTIKTNTGNDIVAGGLTAGMIVLGIVSGSTFRLVSDQGSAAIVAAAEAAAAAAEAAAASINIRNVSNRTTLKALDTTVTTLAFLGELGREGFFKWSTGDFSAQISADTQEGVYIKADAVAATAGAWVRDFEGSVFPRWFGAVGDGVADDTTAMFAAFTSGFNVNVSWGIYRLTDKITSPISDLDIYAYGYPRVGNDVLRSATILIDNPALDYALHFTGTNVTVSNIKFTSSSVTTAEPMLFKRPDGSPADIDGRVFNCVFEGGFALGFTVVGRGMHVVRNEFGNLTRGFAIDVPTDWVPNGQTNDLQETAWRSYVIEDNLFHGTATWVTNVGANKQYVRGIVMTGNLGDIGGCPFEGCLVDSMYNANNSNIGNSSGTVLKLHAGSRNSTIIGRIGGIKEGAASRMPNNCVQLATSTANPSRDLTFIGSFGPCLRDAFQFFGEGPMYGIKLNGVSIDRPAQTTGTGYVPISVFNSGGVLTRVELAIIGLSVDLTGTDSATIIGGTNSAAIEITWIAPQIRGRDIPVAQSLVKVFQSGADTNPEYALYSRKNGTWATDGSEWFARLIALTNDVSGGGVGIAGAWTLLPQTSTGAGAFWRVDVSNSSARKVPSMDFTAAGLSPPTTDTHSLGTSSLFMLRSYSTIMSLKDGIAAPLAEAGTAQIFVDAADGDLKIIYSDGTVKTIVVDT